MNLSDLSAYKGKLVSISIGCASRSLTKEFISDSSLIPTRLKKSKYQFIPINLDIEISANSRLEFEQLKGKLVSDLSECTITMDDIPDRIYDAWMNGDPTITKDLPEVGDIACQLYAICYGSEISKAFTRSITFTNNGDSESPAVLSLTTNIALTSLTISGMTPNAIIVSNVAKDSELIIDGVNCLITQGGVNKFGDTDMWKFPTLQPGSNTVGLSTDCNATLTYKPRYI